MTTQRTFVIGSDHRGFALKTLFIARLKDMGHAVIDVGPETDASCDAGDYAQKAVLLMRDNPSYTGILICMSGQAMTMTANRYQHIRAAMCLNTTMARLARQHNDANVMTLGAYIVGQEVAMDCLETFVNTAFLGGRFEPRREKLTAMGGL